MSVRKTSRICELPYLNNNKKVSCTQQVYTELYKEKQLTVLVRVFY